jgi:hypothetical protein
MTLFDVVRDKVEALVFEAVETPPCRERNPDRPPVHRKIRF